MHWTEILALFILAAAVLPMLAGVYFWLRPRLSPEETAAQSDRNSAGSSRLGFWLLAPVFTLFVVLMPFLVPQWRRGSIALIICLETLAVMFLFFLYDRKRFAWTLHAASGCVALLFFLPLFQWVYIHLIGLIGRNAAANAQPVITTQQLKGLVVIGIPALLFALNGLRRHDGQTDTRRAVGPITSAIEDLGGKADDSPE